MLDKKKHHFLQLVIIFLAITVIALLSAWGYKSKSEMSMGMMGQSMGKMMSTMHAKNASLNDLFVQQESMEMAPDTQSHHQADKKLKTTHFFTTAIIAILLPFILAGVVFLTIMWIK